MIWQDFLTGLPPSWALEDNYYQDENGAVQDGVKKFEEQAAKTLLCTASARGLIIPLKRLVPSLFSNPEFISGIDDILNADDGNAATGQCDHFFRPGLKKRMYGEAPFYVKLSTLNSDVAAFSRQHVRADGSKYMTALAPYASWPSIRPADLAAHVGGSYENYDSSVIGGSTALKVELDVDVYPRLVQLVL